MRTPIILLLLLSCGVHPKQEDPSLLPDRVAEYEGGMEAFQQFVANKVRYPQAARKRDIQGKVIVRFVVNTAGEVTRLQTIGEKIGYGLEEEAVRVVALTSGKWKPAIMAGKYVNVRFEVPINFELY